MKAKVLEVFRDRHNGKIYEIGDILTISRERFQEILSVAPLVEEVKAAKETTAK